MIIIVKIIVGILLDYFIGGRLIIVLDNLLKNIWLIKSKKQVDVNFVLIIYNRVGILKVLKLFLNIKNLEINLIIFGILVFVIIFKIMRLLIIGKFCFGFNRFCNKFIFFVLVFLQIIFINKNSRFEIRLWLII